jgi:DNA-binding CsgD family transcriptional regulator
MIRTMHGGCATQHKREVGLGPRERMVLEAYVCGKGDRETARELGRSVHTIRAIARTLRRKFGIPRMEELVAAVKRGDYRIRRSEERYNLASALKVLEEGLRAMNARQELAPVGNPRASVRLHELEVEALLRIGHAVLGDGERAE